MNLNDIPKKDLTLQLMMAGLTEESSHKISLLLKNKPQPTLIKVISLFGVDKLKEIAALMEKATYEDDKPLLEAYNVGLLEMLSMALDDYQDGKISLAQLNEVVAKAGPVLQDTMKKFNEVYMGKTGGV